MQRHESHYIVSMPIQCIFLPSAFQNFLQSISIVLLLYCQWVLVEIRTSEFLGHRKKSLDTFIVIVYGNYNSDMPKLMTRKPSIEHSWFPFLGPAVCVDDYPGNIAEQRFDDGSVEEEGIGNASGVHEVKNGDYARGG